MTRTIDRMLKSAVVAAGISLSDIDISALTLHNLEAQFFKINYDHKGELTQIYWDRRNPDETRRYRLVYPIVDVERKVDYFLLHMGKPTIYEDWQK